MPPPPPARAEMRIIPTAAEASLGDYRRYPGCRLLLGCAACSWSKHYSPERIIDRLRELRAGGHTTRLDEVARRVAWTCPACHRMRWRAGFAWPPEIGPREVRRLTNRERS